MDVIFISGVNFKDNGLFVTLISCALHPVSSELYVDVDVVVGISLHCKHEVLPIVEVYEVPEIQRVHVRAPTNSNTFMSQSLIHMCAWERMGYVWICARVCVRLVSPVVSV